MNLNFNKHKDTNNSIGNQANNSLSESENIKSEIDASTSFCRYCSTNKTKDSAIEVYMGDLSTLSWRDIVKLYKERPCMDVEIVLRYDIKKWLEQKLKEVINHLQISCNLQGKESRNYYLVKAV